MSLVFSAIAAHTPLLIPTIGKEGHALVAKTTSAMRALEQALYVTNPDTIVVISPHGPSVPDAVTMNLSGKFVSNFQEFGDLVTKREWRPDIMLIDRLREDFTEKRLPLTLDNAEQLDYGASVPLFYLTDHLPKARVVPISTGGLDLKTHYALGRELKDEIMKSTSRIAVIAAADLSHRAGENAPDGFSPRGAAFDEKIRELVEKKNPVGVLDVDEAWTLEARACGAKPVAMLFGMLQDMQHESELLSYEKPLGVGYLVAAMRVT